MNKDAIIMIHNVRTFDSNPNTKEIQRLNNSLYDMLENNCDTKIFSKIMYNNKHADLYLNAQMCLRYKIIDFIGMPKLMFC